MTSKFSPGAAQKSLDSVIRNATFSYAGGLCVVAAAIMLVVIVSLEAGGAAFGEATIWRQNLAYNADM